MEAIEYRTMDKDGWGPGPWRDEPDKLQYELDGMPCLIKRNRMGALCGYVGVTEGHPFFGKGCDDCDVRVHGGLTYADFRQDGDEARAICHVPGEPDRVWWLGFDCSHAWDLCPAHNGLYSDSEVYRDIDYVKDEIAGMVEQLKG